MLSNKTLEKQSNKIRTSGITAKLKIQADANRQIENIILKLKLEDLERT